MPNREKAVVEKAKLRDYLLSPSHPVGRFKAAFFRGLGFGRDDWVELRTRLLESAAAGNVEPQTPTEFGTKYVVRGTLVGPNRRTAAIVSLWFVSLGEPTPRFITAYPE